ncbi:MAG: tetratricopeptide repeat protein [Proteobacteria bacterium]|nr:tetratricopeptide repeat protein [Pseudomonadota bacterium]MBU1386420.1 tetratricopeptide repeat protein [Pseudomonadota bacterium]MBU1544531.1 tetratricopeptide repeat protein [Pseudomonadota bacterium]
MKLRASLLLILFLSMSCATTTMNTDKKKEIAVATQRLGEEYYNAGKYTSALQNLLEAYRTIPNDPYLNNSLGLVYLAKDRSDLAETHFKKALSLKPDYIHAKNNLGAVFMKQKKWDLAIQCFTEVSENLLYATPEMPLSNLGWAYFNQKLYKKATYYFKKSLEVRPDFLISIHGLASVYTETGLYYQARDYLLRNLGKYPDAAILHADIATVYEKLNDPVNARKSWQRVLNLVPETSSLAQEAQKKLYNH